VAYEVLISCLRDRRQLILIIHDPLYPADVDRVAVAVCAATILAALADAAWLAAAANEAGLRKWPPSLFTVMVMS
jgi:hypothetical protein